MGKKERCALVGCWMLDVVFWGRQGFEGCKGRKGLP